MPGRFEKLGISFQYPENWSLDEDEALQGNQSVTVYSPSGGAFWSVAVHPRSADPLALSRAAVQAMKEEYTDLEAEPFERTEYGRELVGFDLSFYCFDLISAAAVRSVQDHRASYTVFYQAEDREFDELRMVFEAMTVSFLNGLQPLPEA